MLLLQYQITDIGLEGTVWATVYESEKRQFTKGFKFWKLSNSGVKYLFL